MAKHSSDPFQCCCFSSGFSHSSQEVHNHSPNLLSSLELVLRVKSTAIDISNGNVQEKKTNKRIIFIVVDSVMGDKTSSQGKNWFVSHNQPDSSGPAFSIETDVHKYVCMLAKAENTNETYLPNHFTNGLNCFHLIRFKH